MDGLSGMQGGPVDELLGVAAERPAIGYADH
jgi:hypothetical protein